MPMRRRVPTWMGLFPLLLPCSLSAQWEAVNDHYGGPGTGLNVTRYNVLDQDDGMFGPLRNLVTGEALPVTLTISSSGLFGTDPFGAAPAEGTPLFAAFEGWVDWDGNQLRNVAIGTGGNVTYTLSGLDPAKPYVLQGGAVRGYPNGINWWSLFSLTGAESFTAVHAGGLTAQDVPGDIADNEVAINTGRNHLPDQGHMFEWRDVMPGDDGTVQIVSIKYAGAVPGGTSGGVAPRGLAPTALKIVEAVPTPPSIFKQPESVVAEAGGRGTCPFQLCVPRGCLPSQ